jgi:hypothetical protein
MPKVVRQLRACRVFSAAVRGWKIRRIMNQTNEVIAIKREMADINYDMRQLFSLG